MTLATKRYGRSVIIRILPERFRPPSPRVEEIPTYGGESRKRCVGTFAFAYFVACYKTAKLGPGESRQLDLSQWCVLLPDKVVVAGRERHDHNSFHNLDTGCFPRREGPNQPMYLSRNELAVRVSGSEGSRPPLRYFSRAVSACPSASYP
jgi:hypothetical protein